MPRTGNVKGVLDQVLLSLLLHFGVCPIPVCRPLRLVSAAARDDRQQQHRGRECVFAPHSDDVDSSERARQGLVFRFVPFLWVVSG